MLRALSARDHPRVICLGTTGCAFGSPTLAQNNSTGSFSMNSIPSTKEEQPNNSYYDTKTKPPPYHSTEECTMANPSYNSLAEATPSTCNTVHSMDFTSSSLNNLQQYPIENSINFLTQGGYNSIWKYTSHNTNDKVIMKMHRPSRQFSIMDLERNRRDVLLSSLAGGPPSSHPNHNNNNVVSIHQYCGYTLIVPMATTSLDDYVQNYKDRHGRHMDAYEMYQLGYQAANGLYQSHLYLNGKATAAHSDVKPSQFLLFDSDINNNNSSHALPEDKRFPILQLNDFNRCRLLYQTKNGTTCPFRMCGIKHKGSKYRSPEEYMDCADQDDKIDVFSLAGVFYFLLSDGLDPFGELDFEDAVGRILKGELPDLPPLDKKGYDAKLDGNGEELVLKERSMHPAFVAVEDIMLKCWRFDPNDRPSSFEVVKMFEDHAHNVLI
jgi:hypothetical protein